jgi:hypothetical protein
MANTNYWTLLENHFSKEQVTEVIESAKQQSLSLATDDDVYCEFVRWGMHELDRHIAECQIKVDKYKNDKDCYEYKYYSDMLKCLCEEKKTCSTDNMPNELQKSMFECYSAYLKLIKKYQNFRYKKTFDL